MNIIPAKVKRIACALTGHRWAYLIHPSTLKTGAPMVQCLRCGEIGWSV